MADGTIDAAALRETWYEWQGYQIANYDGDLHNELRTVGVLGDAVPALLDRLDSLAAENAALHRLMDAYGRWERSHPWGGAEEARLLHNAYVDALRVLSDENTGDAGEGG